MYSGSDCSEFIGRKYNKLTMLSTYMKRLPSGRGRTYAICQCECGNIYEGRLYQIKNGTRMSCGCMYRRHGDIKIYNSTFTSYRNMKERCNNPNYIGFHNYGGRGITVCDRWEESFDNFLEDMGERPEGMSLDRIDVNGNYEPSNCRWATNKEQARNKRHSLYIEYNGETALFADLCDKYNIPQTIAYNRIFRYGWTIKKALTTKIKKYKCKHK